MSNSVDPKPDGDTKNAGNGTQRRLSRKGESLYQILDLKKGATAEEVKKKYRCIDKEYDIKILVFCCKHQPQIIYACFDSFNVQDN